MQHSLIAMQCGSQFWNNRGVVIFRICCGRDNNGDSPEQASGRKGATLDGGNEQSIGEDDSHLRVILHNPNQTNKDFGHFRKLRESGISRQDVTSGGESK